MIRRPFPLALAALALTGCSVQPSYLRPAPAVPETWPTGPAYRLAGDSALPAYSWREVFTDPRLQAVIEQALANNQDLAAAAANIALARAQLDAQRAQQLPQVDATLSATRGDNGSGSARSSGGSGGTGGTGGQSGASTSLRAEVGVSGYEIDLFGRLASLSSAARSRYFASEAAARATRLALIAQVANAWLAHGADNDLLALARRTAQTSRESLKLTQARYNGGVAPRSDVRQAEIVLRTAEADVAAQITQVAQDANALRLLVGAEVAPSNLPTTMSDALGRIADVPPGLDSGILLRRPDVMEAEWQLQAATAEIGAARAALFPRFTLTGLLGLASNALTSLFSAGSFAWQAGGGANYSIFSGGAARANVRVSEAQRDAALAGYRKAVQTAFADVADALARRGTIADQLAAANATSVASADNLQLAGLRYRGGVDSYLQELTARLTSYNADRSLIATQRTAAENRVAVYRALGGDGSI